jgi:hypothetical protein
MSLDILLRCDFANAKIKKAFSLSPSKEVDEV